MRRTVCDCCGRQMEKAHSVHEGKGYCGTCYKREFKKIPCEQCGKTIRTLGGVGPAICKSCRTLGRKCVRCGEGVPRAGLVVGAGVACISCARQFKEPQHCPVCGQLSLYLSRDLKNGFTEPVCQQCRRKGHITCSCCNKNRRPAGVTTDGRVVCAKCLETDGQPFVCPKCGKTGKRHSSTRCEACYWAEYVEKKLRSAVAMLSNQWTKDAFSRFVPELIDRIQAHGAATRIERHFLFFARLDACFSRPLEATASAMISTFGLNGLRLHSTAYGFLVKDGILPKQSADEIKAAAASVNQARLVESCSGAWYHDIITGFHAHLEQLSARYATRGWTGKRERFGPRTVTVALRSGIKFISSLDQEKIHSVQQIEQIQLDRFISTNKGYRNGVRAFVRYLNKTQKLFRKLKVDTVSTNLPPNIFLGHDRYTTLLWEWLNPSDETLKESIICLLMLLYAQRGNKIVRLRLADISHGNDGSYRMLFGRTEIALDNRIGALFDRYLAVRKALATMEDAWENAYLFTGRASGDHLKEAAVSYYLKKYKVTAEQLFSTSILYAYLSGLRHPKILVKAFGITDITAIKYMNLINPRMRDELEDKMVANG